MLTMDQLHRDRTLVDRYEHRASVIERSRLAAELHDGVSQELYVAAMQLHEVLSSPGLTPDARARVGLALDSIRNSGNQIRRAMLDLTEVPATAVLAEAG